MAEFKFRERITPEGRILAKIKYPEYGGLDRTLLEIKGFTQVTTSTSMSGQATATITFPNYKSVLMRFVSEDVVREVEKKNRGLETTNSYAKTFMKELTDGDTVNYFKPLWDDLVPNVVEPFPANVRNTNFFDANRSRGQMQVDTNIMKTVNEEGLIHALNFIDLFTPIFVDFKGQDGFWYAGFTGLVSNIGDEYTKTGNQSINIQCKDLSVLFDNASLISGWHRMSVAESKSNLRNFFYSTEANVSAAQNGAYPNIFSRYSRVTDIILAVVDTAQDLWRLPDFGKGVGVHYFKFDTSKVYKYNGLSPRRGSVAESDDEENMNPEDFREDYSLRERHYLYDGSKFSEKKIFVDPLIINFDNVFIHKLLSSNLSLYKDSVKSADEILNDLVAKMMAYKYFDPNGNMIIELPKYNAFPNLNQYGGRGGATVIRHIAPKIAKKSVPQKLTAKVQEGETKEAFAARASKIIGKTLTVAQLVDLNDSYTNTAVFVPIPKSGGRTIYVLKKGATVKISEDTQPVTPDPLKDIKTHSIKPDRTETILPGGGKDEELAWYATKFHGKNYVLTHDDFVSFNTAIDESGFVTLVASDTALPYLEKFNENLLFSRTSLHGVSVAGYDALAKLGVRRYQTQTLYNVSWSDIVGSRVLSYQSSAIMERINAEVDSGSVSLLHRPELQVGRTFINPIRMKSYLIIGTSNTWSPGGQHSTVLTISYGHPIHKTLEMPWTAIFSEPEQFGFEDGVASFTKIKPVGQYGEIKPNEDLEESP